MTDDYLNLDDISEQVLNVITKFKLTPTSFGVAITLKKDEFEQIAEKHPDYVRPDLIMRTESEANGIQWYVQISKEMSLDNTSNK